MSWEVQAEAPKTLAAQQLSSMGSLKCARSGCNVHIPRRLGQAEPAAKPAAPTGKPATAGLGTTDRGFLSDSGLGFSGACLIVKRKREIAQRERERERERECVCARVRVHMYVRVLGVHAFVSVFCFALPLSVSLRPWLELAKNEPRQTRAVHAPQKNSSPTVAMIHSLPWSRAASVVYGLV